MIPEFLTPKEAAEYLNLSVSWLAICRMHQRGPAFYRHGRAVRYRIVDLEAWLAQQRVGTEA